MTKKNKLTKEQLELMAGLLPMRAGSTYEFTPKVFKSLDEELQPSIFVSQLSKGQVSTCRELWTRDTNKKKKPTMAETEATEREYMDIAYEITKKWSNMYDLGSGELLEYDGSREMFDSLPDFIQKEILTVGIDITGFLPK